MAAEADKTRKLDFDEIQIPPGPRLGSIVVEAKGLTKGFDDKLLIDDLSFTLPRNGIVGVIGPNGVGKTTLFKMIVAEAEGGSDDKDVLPDSGDLRIGETVKLSYVDQNRGGIDPEKNLWEVVSDGLDWIKVGQVEMPSRAYVSAFGFKGTDQQKKAGVLSGGERNRLNLALTLKHRRQPDPARRAHQRPRRRDPRLAGERAARVPRLRGDHLARPLVPRPRGDAHPRLRGRLAPGSGSRATSTRTRRTRSTASAPTRPDRTGRRTASSPATEPRRWPGTAITVQLRWSDMDCARGT